MDVPSALPTAFFDRAPQAVAAALLGQWLVRRTDRALLIGRIVETEAYLSADDTASHGASPMTERTRVMFGPPGRAYVYTLRQYALLDVTTEAPGVPSAVLLRAVEPLSGVAYMRALAGQPDADVRRLANGPGKLCRTLGIDRTLNGVDLTDERGPLYLAPGTPQAFSVRITPRVGITRAREALLRYTVQGSAFLSRP